MLYINKFLSTLSLESVFLLFWYLKNIKSCPEKISFFNAIFENILVLYFSLEGHILVNQPACKRILSKNITNPQKYYCLNAQNLKILHFNLSSLLLQFLRRWTSWRRIWRLWRWSPRRTWVSFSYILFHNFLIWYYYWILIVDMAEDTMVVIMGVIIGENKKHATSNLFYYLPFI